MQFFENNRVFTVIREYVHERTLSGFDMSEQDWMAQYDRVRRTAWFGKLPHTMQSQTLKAIASEVGEVVKVDLRPAVLMEDGCKSHCCLHEESHITLDTD